MKVCGHTPKPGSGAYGHWSCERRRWHIGRHRFVNYVWPRLWGWKRVQYKPSSAYERDLVKARKSLTLGRR